MPYRVFLRLKVAEIIVGFITGLFGGEGTNILTVLFALGIVLVLIVLGVWALKLLFNATSNVGRGPHRRLSVIDSTAIDPKRQLVLVRRDDVEHLLVLGGPQDMVVETAITPPPEPTPLKRPRRGLTQKMQAEKANGSKPITPPIKEPTPPIPATEPQAPPTKENPLTATVPLAAASVAVDVDPTPDTPDQGEQTTPRRRLTSLRHTGLLRPANRVEPALHPQPSDDQTEFDNEERSDSDTKNAELSRNDAEITPVDPEKRTDASGDGSSESADKKHDDHNQKSDR